MTKLNSNYKQILCSRSNRFITGIIFLFSSFFISATTVYVGIAIAEQPPLAPQLCYVRSAGEYNPTPCPASVAPTEEQCVLITEMPGGSTSNRYESINCDSGNIEELLNPSTSSSVVPQSNIEPSRSFNDGCAEDDENCGIDCESDGVLDSKNCGIVRYLVIIINFLSTVAGLAIIGSIIIAGYQYMTAKDNSGQVEAARKRILWAMVALGIFVFMYSFLNWIIPGGVI